MISNAAKKLIEPSAEAKSDYAVYQLDSEGYIRSWNTGAEQIKGYKADEVIGRHYSIFFPDEMRRNLLPRKLLGLALERGRHTEDGWRVRKDGTKFLARVVLTRTMDEKGDFTGFIKVTQDISASRLYETGLNETFADLRARVAQSDSALAETDRMLLESEARYRRIIENASEGIWTIDKNNITDFVSGRMAKMMGYSPEEMIGQPIARFMDGDNLKLAASRIALQKTDNRVDLSFLRKDGSPLHVSMMGDPILDAGGEYRGTTAFVTDITEQRLVEQKFLQAQKMEAVGQLAGGVAHDFNNLLAVVMLHAECLLEQPDDKANAGLREGITQIKEAAERGAQLTKQLLAFSRRQIQCPKVLDLNGCVAETARFVKRLIGENIEMTIETEPELGMVKIDPGQINQVLMNLVVNARDAMPGGGRLQIETANVSAGAVADRYFGTKLGECVEVKVSDSGTGMTKEVLARIFEPFFTTKERGKGTGLGLATVIGIVRQSGGDISVTSEPGKGTTFRLFFPVFEGKPEAAASEAEPAMRLLESGTILVVEDEEPLLRATAAMLRRSGYTVLEARNGVEAIQVFSAHEGKIDLIMSDMMMPEMSGPDFIRSLISSGQAQRDELKVLFLSGYPELDATSSQLHGDNMHFLEKPYTGKRLLKEIKAAMK